MSETTTLGEISRDGDAVVLRYDRMLAHPPEKVWRAITESEHLRHWFPADLVGERAAGADLRIEFWPEVIERSGAEIEAAGLDLDDATQPGRVLTWEPPRVFEYTWDTERLHFELTPTSDGTRLVVTIRAVDPAPRGFQSTAAGYHVCLDALVAHLDGTEPVEDESALGAALEERYAALL